MHSGGVNDGSDLERRLAPYTHEPRAIDRSAFAGDGRPLRTRIDAGFDRLARRFELDRLLYELEVEAQRRWLSNLAAFDAFLARRDREQPSE